MPASCSAAASFGPIPWIRRKSSGGRCRSGTASSTVARGAGTAPARWSHRRDACAPGGRPLGSGADRLGGAAVSGDGDRAGSGGRSRRPASATGTQSAQWPPARSAGANRLGGDRLEQRRGSSGGRLGRGSAGEHRLGVGPDSARRGTTGGRGRVGDRRPASGSECDGRRLLRSRRTARGNLVDHGRRPRPRSTSGRGRRPPSTMGVTRVGAVPPAAHHPADHQSHDQGQDHDQPLPETRRHGQPPLCMCVDSREKPGAASHTRAPGRQGGRPLGRRWDAEVSARWRGDGCQRAV